MHSGQSGRGRGLQSRAREEPLHKTKPRQRLLGLSRPLLPALLRVTVTRVLQAVLLWRSPGPRAPRCGTIFPEQDSNLSLINAHGIQGQPGLSRSCRCSMECARCSVASSSLSFSTCEMETVTDENVYLYFAQHLPMLYLTLPGQKVCL